MEPDQIRDILEIALQTIGIFSVIASGVPIPQKATSIITIIRKLIDLGAFNFGSAKNLK